MKIINSEEKILEITERGIEQIIEKESLISKLKSGRKLRIKLGVDPTGSKIHIGRAIQLWKLKVFQEMGHLPVLIIGDFTAKIGDASDKQAMRKPLSDKEIKENMKSYEKQISKILDLKKIEIRYNSEWLAKLSLSKLISLAMNFTSQQMIQRRNFKERWDAEKPIGLHELFYPLFQGYDSFAVKADVEIGGSDQLFNLKAGREIQSFLGQKQQDIMTMKMLYGLDGRKMSTSWGNVVNMADEPADMYGKIMSMKDELILDYFELCVFAKPEEISNIKKQLESGANPRNIKADLAGRIVSLYHGDKKADFAKNEFEKVFQQGGIPEDIIEIEIKEVTLPLMDLLVRVNLAQSKTNAKQLIAQKGVKIDNNIQDDWNAVIEIKKGLVLQAGKRRFVKII
jgi:tyrosyl-tRNA synthetase